MPGQPDLGMSLLDPPLRRRERSYVSRGVLLRPLCQVRLCVTGPSNGARTDRGRYKEPYYLALEAADEHFEKEVVDLSQMEGLLDDCIANQLLSAYRDASDPAAGGPKERKLH